MKDASEFSGRSDEQAFVITTLVVTLLSTAAGMINIGIINRMKLSGYLRLILLMTYLQLLYDALVFNSLVAFNVTLSDVVFGLQHFGGMGSSLVSNWIAFIVVYIIYCKKSFSITENFYSIVASITLPSALIVLLYFISLAPSLSQTDLGLYTWYMYYYIRLVSIIVNFILTGIALYANFKIRSKKATRTEAEVAISTLCRRLVYYPLVQTIGRSGFAWYEFQWGFDFEVRSTRDDPLRYGVLLYSAIISTCVAVGYLFIFLRIEPTAYGHFLQMLGLDAGRHLERQERPSEAKDAKDEEAGRGTNTNRPSDISLTNEYNNSDTTTQNGSVIGSELLKKGTFWGRVSTIIFDDPDDAEADDFYPDDRDGAELLDAIAGGERNRPSREDTGNRRSSGLGAFVDSMWGRSSSEVGTGPHSIGEVVNPVRTTLAQVPEHSRHSSDSIGAESRSTSSTDPQDPQEVEMT
ncbi:hypothetical protein B484DRAFT_453931 [Ochromonadaceae sp. CCMP2298]|nr:hypothetical protein B484DRAFT_453931 [Ochromonadaceae sp. CCMP2298]